MAFIVAVKGTSVEILTLVLQCLRGTVQVSFSPPRCAGVGVSRVLGTWGTPSTPHMVPHCFLLLFQG